MSHKTKILITIDVECSIGGHFCNPTNLPVGPERHIFCKIGGIDYGIGMIMDILDEYGLRAVFFVETEARHYFGGPEIADVVKYILKRGHEVQLHIHTEFRFFKKKSPIETISPFTVYSLDEQRAIIGEGKAFLEASGAKPITAFRSGSLFSNADTLLALRDNGIPYSSSYNLSCRERYESGQAPHEHNAPFIISGLTELPITCIKQSGLRHNPFRPFQVCAISSREFERATRFYIKNNISVIMIITHSFEFVISRNPQYTNLRPYKLLINRFRSLCECVSSARGQADVVTFDDIYKNCGTESIVAEGVNNFYKSPLIDVLARDIQQIICR